MEIDPPKQQALRPAKEEKNMNSRENNTETVDHGEFLEPLSSILRSES